MKWLGVTVLILLPLLAIEQAVRGEYEMAVLTTVIAAFAIYPVLRMWIVKTFNSESPPSQS
jgi:hypothetical protein